jgi:hypothetical protein
MGIASVMRPIDAHATGFFSSGIMERNGFLAAGGTSHHGGAAGRAIRLRDTQPQRL